MAIEVKLALCVERIDALQKTLEEHISNQRRETKEVKKEIQEMSRMFVRYKGTLGGIILTLSAVATVVTIAWGWFTGKNG